MAKEKTPHDPAQGRTHEAPPELARHELQPPAPPVVEAGEKASFREPRNVKLESSDPNKTPTGPLANPEPVPRVCHQSERAPEGLGRFKVFCHNYHPARARYILAHDEEEAKRFYLEASGLAAVTKQLQDRGLRDFETPALSCRLLED